MRSTYQGLLLQALLRAQQITVDLRPLADVRAGAEREETLSRAGGCPQYIDQFITAQPREDVLHCIVLHRTVQHLLESTVVFFRRSRSARTTLLRAYKYYESTIP